MQLNTLVVANACTHVPIPTIGIELAHEIPAQQLVYILMLKPAAP